MAKRNATPSDVIEAADALLAAVRERIHQMPDTLEVDDLIDTFEAKAGADVANAVRPVLRGQAAQYVAAKQRGSMHYDVIKSTRERQLAMVLKTVFEHLVNAQEPDAITKAREALTAVEAEQQETVRALEAAVAQADVDEVLRLRTEAEVFAPQRVAEARAALLDLEVDHLESAGADPAAHAEAARTASVQADENLKRAQLAVQAAQTEMQTAQWRQLIAETGANGAATRVQRKRAERDSEQQRAQQSQQQRLRRLAGLSETVNA